MTIGERVVQAIRERAKQNGTTLEVEKRQLGISQGCYTGYKYGRFDPSALVLQQMLRNGYDIVWILGGNKMAENRSTEKADFDYSAEV